MKEKILAQGAEAIIIKKGNREIVKNRIKKSYRIEILDQKLRKTRTRGETKIMNKLNKIIFVPKIFSSDEKEKIVMEYIGGDKLSETLKKLDYLKICREIAESISKMHDQDIIHGDLTTSNMIFNNKVYFIDFGLSFHSHKIEDKAVDLHLLRQALEAKHFDIWQECWASIINNYKAKQAKEIMHRIKVIESRGRYKDKY